MNFLKNNLGVVKVVFITFFWLSTNADSVPGVYFDQMGYGDCAHGDLQLPYFANYDASAEIADAFTGTDVSAAECLTLCGEQDECLGYLYAFGACFLYHAQGVPFENLGEEFVSGLEEAQGTDVTGVDPDGAFSDIPEFYEVICFKKMIINCDAPTQTAGYVISSILFTVTDCTAQTDGCTAPMITGVTCAEGYLETSAGISVTQCSDDSLATQFTGCQYVEWNTGGFGDCTSHYGIGKMFRSVTCSTGNNEDCSALEKPPHMNTCQPSIPSWIITNNGGRCVTPGTGLNHRRCIFTYTGASDDCQSRCTHDPWCKGYAKKTTGNYCELATTADCGEANEADGTTYELATTNQENGLLFWESGFETAGCRVKSLSTSSMDIYDNNWQKENLLLTKPNPIQDWHDPDNVESPEIFWFSAINAEKFFDVQNWADFDWEVTMNHGESAVVRVFDDRMVMMQSNMGQWEFLQHSNGRGVYAESPLGDWVQNDILTEPARLCRIHATDSGCSNCITMASMYAGFDVSDAQLYNCYADDGGCDDYVIEGEITCTQGYVLEGEISVQQCTDSDAMVTLTGCVPVECQLPQSQEGYSYDFATATVSNCDTVNGCDNIVITGVSCDVDYGLPEGEVLSALTCTLDNHEVELTGCNTEIDMDLCASVDEEMAPAICALLAMNLGGMYPINCEVGDECAANDGSRRSLQTGIRITARASVPNAEDALALLENPEYLESIDWESAGLNGVEISLVSAEQQPTNAPTISPTFEVETFAAVDYLADTDFIIIGVVGLIAITLVFLLCKRKSEKNETKLLNEDATSTPGSVSIVFSDVDSKQTPGTLEGIWNNTLC